MLLLYYSVATSVFHQAKIFAGGKMELVKFYVVVIRIAIVLAMLGQLKGCTLVMMGKAAGKNKIMSYSKFSGMPTQVTVGREDLAPYFFLSMVNIAQLSNHLRFCPRRLVRCQKAAALVYFAIPSD
jgi:hypothetical protein